MPYTVGKLKRRALQKAKENPIWTRAIREIRPQKSPKTKSRDFMGMSWSNPYPTGDHAKGRKSICMEGGLTHSGLAIVNPLSGVSEQTTNPINEP